MGISEPAYILKTNDGGETWKLVYENKTKGMFLDAMEFWNEQAGIVVATRLMGNFLLPGLLIMGPPGRTFLLINGRLLTAAKVVLHPVAPISGHWTGMKQYL